MTNVTETSLPGRSDGSSLHYTGWNKKNPVIYVRGNKVIHSVSWEFPPGSEMTDDKIRDAKARGYLIMMVTESTITPDVETQPVSAGKAQKRIPKDPCIMLNEIDPDRLSEDVLNRYIHLCDAGLKFLNAEFAEDLRTPEFVSLVEWFDVYGADDLEETKMANRTPLSKKLASAKRYRNRRQHILNKKKEAESRKSQQIIKRKMAFSLKTRTGREERKYHVNESNYHEGWFGKGTKFSDFMAYHNQKNREANQEWIIEYLKPVNRKLVVLEHDGTKTDSDLFVFRKIRETNKLLEKCGE